MEALKAARSSTLGAATKAKNALLALVLDEDLNKRREALSKLVICVTAFSNTQEHYVETMNEEQAKQESRYMTEKMTIFHDVVENTRSSLRRQEDDCTRLLLDPRQ
ncbi:hypothetical protein CAPTEDRAFT_206421, partial [Capitella teleta]